MLVLSTLLSAQLTLAQVQQSVRSVFGAENSVAQTAQWGNFILQTGEGGSALQQFKERYPGTWFVWNDPDTGLPARLYGSGIPLVAPPLQSGTVLPAARSFLETAKTVLGLGTLQPLPALRSAADSRFVEFRFLKGALPLEEHSRVGLVIKENGVLALIKSDRIPKSFESASPTIQATRAVDRAFASLGVRRDGFSVSRQELTYIVVRGTARLAWRFRIRNNSLDNPVAKEFFVHARGKGEILEEREGIIHAYSGDVSSYATLGATNDPPVMTVEPDARVKMASNGEMMTDAAGNFSFFSGTGNQTIESRLDGRWSNVDNQAGSDSFLSVTAGAGDNFHFTHNPGKAEFATAEATAFHWVTGVHNWSAATISNGMNFEVTTNVNIASACNAYWDGSSLNFYRAGSDGVHTCPNTAHDKTIIAHEYGHGIDSGLGGMLDRSYSEGFGDAVAMNLTDQSCTGIGLYGPGTCLRDGEDIRYWPVKEEGDCVGEQLLYCQGSVYAQFTREFTNQLKITEGDAQGLATAKNLVLLPASYNSMDIPDAVMDTFVADDNDGNLTNETPHFCEIQKAADSRKLPYNILTNIVYVDNGITGEERGTCSKPYNTVGEGVTATPNGGTLRIDAGNYAESNITVNKAMNIEPLNGQVTIGQ